MLRKLNIFLLLAFLLTAGTRNVLASTESAPLASGGEVISAINGYRAVYGLTQLTPNAILNSVAQGQADYQASIQTVTHTGPGGSSARDRAIAAGYSGGNITYYSEIIYGGYNASASDALTWWQNSAVHNGVMLEPKYVEIGAGVAVSGSTVYFTAVLATPNGSSTGSTSSTGGTDSGSTDPETGVDNSAPVIMPVQKAAPQEDGSIIHIVEEGQTLWTIEAVYGLEPGTLRTLNEIPSYPYVFPGDELIIRPAGEYEDVDTETQETPLPGTAVNGDGKVADVKPVIGTPFSFVDPEKVTPTAPIIITKPARTQQPVVDASNDQGGLFQGNSTAKTIVIAALLILVVVLIGSMFIQKPAEQPPQAKD